MPLVYHLLIAVGVLALLYFGLRGVIGTFLKFRGTRVITCPESQDPAAVRVNAQHAAITAAMDKADLRLNYCSRWPERQDCGQECLAQIEAAPEDCLVRNILTKWYAGKSCVLCKKPLAEVNWTEHKPALLSPERKTVEWYEIRPETIPAVLASHSPVCWDCHIAETFRREHPELVVDRDFRQTTASRN